MFALVQFVNDFVAADGERGLALGAAFDFDMPCCGNPCQDRTGWCHRQSLGLQPPALAGLQPLCGNRTPPHRQQPHRKLHPPDCHRQEKLAVRGFGTGRCPCSRHPNFTGHSQTQRPEPQHMAERHLGKIAHLAQQPH